MIFCLLQTAREGFVQPVPSEAKGCRQGGSVAHELFPAAPNCDECQPFTEAAGGNEGMHSCNDRKSDYGRLSLYLCQINSEMGQTSYISPCYPKSQFWTGLDTKVSSAPCLLGGELQRSPDPSHRLLAYPVPSAAQQGPAC